MLNEILHAVVQAATEFLPVSSSGHLALFGNLVSEPNLFLITILHFASLLAVLWFTRKEIIGLLNFKDERVWNVWLMLVIATIPAVIVGLLFKDLIEQSLSSLFFVGGAFIFSGLVVFSTKFCGSNLKLTNGKSFLVGLMQSLALFPGISRSGMTISAGMIAGVEKKSAMKFSFLLFIPLALGAMLLELGEFYFSWSLLVAFLVCFVLSLIFLNLLELIIKKNWFWVFSIYLFLIGAVSLVLGFIGV
jgi:undecaprenyl-diphosphatase